MSIIKSLEKRRSYYSINKELPVSEAEIEENIKKVTELVPDAFNMKSARVVVLFGKQHDKFWDEVFDVFEGKVSKDKLSTFSSGAGTILYFYDENVVKGLQEKFALYADNFPVWANHANAMLQLSIWTMLRELNVGASLQHYNPVIDERIKKVFNIPENYKLVAQMPFGGIVDEPAPKDAEDVNKRVSIMK